MDIYKAASLLEVEIKTLREFDVQDPYNPNTLQGYLCLQSDFRYGTIIIHSVNNLRLNNAQIIYGTPKLIYPFYTNDKTGERVYKWPKFNRVRVYEKFDGCLNEDSVVITENGEETVKEVCDKKISKRVVALDFDSYEAKLVDILKYSVNDSDEEWYEIELEDDTKVKLTSNHYVWVSNLDCYRCVKDLSAEDEVLTI